MIPKTISRSLRASVSVMATLLASVAASGQDTSRRFAAELLPEGTLFAVTTEDLAGYFDGMRSQPLARILAEEEVADFLEMPLSVLWAELEATAKATAGVNPFEVYSAILAARPGRAFAAVTASEPQQDEAPTIGFLIGIEDAVAERTRDPQPADPQDRPADLSILTRIARELDDLVEAGSLTVQTRIAADGGPYQQYTSTTSRESLSSFVVCRRGEGSGQDNLMIAASDAATLDPCLSLLADPTLPTLHGRDSYRAVRARLDMEARASLHAYADVRGMLRLLEPWIDERDVAAKAKGQGFGARDIWDILDPSALLSLGAAFETRDGLSHSRVFLQRRGETMGIFNAWPDLPLDREFLSIVPLDMIRCWSFHFDVAVIAEICGALWSLDHKDDGAWDEFLQRIEEEISVPFRDGLLSNLGPRYLFLNDKGSMIPAYLLVAQSLRPEAAREAVKDLIDFGIARAGREIAVSEIEYQGSTITSLNVGFATPNVAAAEGMVILSSDIQATKRLLRHMKEGGPSILDRPELVAALAGLGPDVTPVGLDFLDVKSTFEHWYGLATTLVGLAAGQDLEIPIDLDLLPIPETISQHLSPAIVVSSVQADGTWFDTSGPVAQEYSVWLFTSVSSVLVYLAADAVREVFEDGTRRTAAAQIKGFEGAIGQYRSVHRGQLPSSLEVLLQPDPQNFNEPYLYTDELPTDPWGNPFQYRVMGSSYKIQSLGADGLPGGEGKNADISSERPRRD